MSNFPLADGFFFCITLRFGAYAIALLDFVSSIFLFISCCVELANPEIVSRHADNSAFGAIGTGHTEFGSNRIMMRSSRAFLLLSFLTLYFSFNGAIAARIGQFEHLRVYLHWKALKTLLTIILHVLLHRIWWDGCGILSNDACMDLRMQYMFMGVLWSLPDFYFLWIVWSLCEILLLGTEEELRKAGYDMWDLEDRRTQDPLGYQAIGSAARPGHTTWLV
uniref:Uncharacterized protein n=1 Tax=Hanusia phi TaxID=3032 RepID=A0A7S0NCN1_9CRYP|mmetsp:Transcript_6471/g.14807  ORF Transcript_6471/g.14807 Transcript_6471/m.14807 type:complete len:221 (+) Transcript_6471:75-737(+)